MTNITERDLPKEPRDASKPLFLFVEDEEAIRRLMKRGVPDVQFRLAPSFKAAVAFMDAGERFDGVITDYDLKTPENGSDVVREVRRRFDGHVPPIWVCTGRDITSDEITSLGVDGVIRKPYVLSEIRGEIFEPIIRQHKNQPAA